MQFIEKLMNQTWESGKKKKKKKNLNLTLVRLAQIWVPKYFFVILTITRR